MDYNKKIVLITGAAGGIGRSLCQAYAKEGATVIATDITKVNFIDKNIHFYKMDLNEKESIEDVFSEIEKKYKKIDILINNGAISYFNRSIFDIEVEEFDRVISVNLRGSFICCKEFLKINNGDEYGRIINIASTRWSQGESGWEAYSASKGGLISMTNTMAVSLGKTKITVNCISPGWIECSDYDNLRKIDHEQHPSGRVGRPEDIARATIFLSHEENDFINGENFVIDGGMTKKMIYTD